MSVNKNTTESSEAAPRSTTAPTPQPPFPFGISLIVSFAGIGGVALVFATLGIATTALLGDGLESLGTIANLGAAAVGFGFAAGLLLVALSAGLHRRRYWAWRATVLLGLAYLIANVVVLILNPSNWANGIIGFLINVLIVGYLASPGVGAAFRR
jgi:hypothetical protein